jgi:hypothetical protein
MNIIVLQPTIIGGVDYQPGILPINVPDNVGKHMIEIGNAKAYETKVVEVAEKKSFSVSQPAPVSPEPIVKKRRGRPAKSSS